MKATIENTSIGLPEATYPTSNRAEAGPTYTYNLPLPTPPPPARTGIFESRIRVVPTFLSYRNYRIFRYLGSSVALSIAVFIFSMIGSLGRASLYLSPGAFGLTAIFQVVMLYNFKQESNQLEVETRHLGDVYHIPGNAVTGVVVNHPEFAPRHTTVIAPVSITAKIWTIICAWILALLWWACVVLICINIASAYISYGSSRSSRDYYWLRGYWFRYAVEAILTFVLATTVTSIATLCTQEWRASKRAGY